MTHELDLDFDTDTNLEQYIGDWESDIDMLDPDVLSSILMSKYSSRDAISEEELRQLIFSGVPEGMRRYKMNETDIRNTQFYEPKRNMFYGDYKSPRSGQIFEQWRPHHSADPPWLITDQDKINERYKTWWEPWGRAGYDPDQAIEAGYGNVDPREHLTYESNTGDWIANPQDFTTGPPVENYTAPDRGDWGPGLHLARGGIASLR